MISQDRANTQPTRQAWWTAKSQNATKASRTAIAEDMAVGRAVTRDYYDFDGRPQSSDVAAIQNVTQPATAMLKGDWGIVIEVNPLANGQSVNDIPDSTAATQRRGGPVLVQYSGVCYAYVADGTAVNDIVGPANASSTLAVIALMDDPNGDTNEFRSKYAVALEANSSGAAALRRIEFRGR